MSVIPATDRGLRPLTVPEIRAHALTIGDDLAGRGVKALVIACNTASWRACATRASATRRSRSSK